MPKRKLTKKDIAPYRDALLRDDNVCPLCGNKIRLGQAALDHDHNTGRVRGVLHLNCNGLEGRIINWASKSGIDPLQFLRNLIEYVDRDFDHMPMHPMGSDEEHKTRRDLNRRLKRAKRESTKRRLRRELEQLNQPDTGSDVLASDRQAVRRSNSAE